MEGPKDDCWVCCDKCDVWRLLSARSHAIVQKWDYVYCADIQNCSCDTPTDEDPRATLYWSQRGGREVTREAIAKRERDAEAEAARKEAEAAKREAEEAERKAAQARERAKLLLQKASASGRSGGDPFGFCPKRRKIDGEQVANSKSQADGASQASGAASSSHARGEEKQSASGRRSSNLFLTKAEKASAVAVLASAVEVALSATASLAEIEAVSESRRKQRRALQQQLAALRRQSLHALLSYTPAQSRKYDADRKDLKAVPYTKEFKKELDSLTRKSPTRLVLQRWVAVKARKALEKFSEESKKLVERATEELGKKEKAPASNGQSGTSGAPPPTPTGTGSPPAPSSTPGRGGTEGISVLLPSYIELLGDLLRAVEEYAPQYVERYESALERLYQIFGRIHLLLTSSNGSGASTAPVEGNATATGGATARPISAVSARPLEDLKTCGYVIEHKTAVLNELVATMLDETAVM
eukprot:g6780.t1